ncbi:MAG: hypothetical protein LW860_17450 [Xanthomonadaceae bacterium]|jgi:hypothetical protein|nr:hypothetical protein [Xanthomonadaceae bacterium]
MDIDEQWARAIEYATTPSAKLDQESPLRYLRAHWRVMAKAEPELVAPAESWRAKNEAVLDACMALIAGGTYPPPELMMVLLECWAEYATARGTPRGDLERIMLGPSVQKSGNYAKRRAWDQRNRIMAMTFYAGICAGKTRHSAATATHNLIRAEWPDETPSVASILDMFRWIKRSTDVAEITSGRVRRTRKRRVGKFG